ncbi:MAG: hypothetical protein A3F82_01060 [Deltaproteobacteria bacterium RIFCSPLOWO2_12_FULL_44_12]|nr:MAG: hypothetical protein A2712_03895 [Deltaproteobacteria bacterium RIFCSPHIGHO2_01_FULL_43_49]OGQ16329.1 MAG: hypothetical protein A3D22_01865 [Deltaproteobacteria bacterium RIFCSPHIGHO2_02_FULL_44_53]OGQ29289.1 MAG: hypothetical protein A3D98_05650 [Deltaproteobacteria bacterium RIFCSPHIGHO2_12_FULL_44_21]OGQ32846.1 MAG: hypothetical protein A2979_09795 [Deltaproteobacteria bacterium RIFCSPLOWO2_01_FULL_45_74]OGQ41947.1 MAG: hypothetical protein A3I70_09580 [Deltaproteobacteria bacterium 
MSLFPKNLDIEQYKSLGVDLTILWENLQMSPTERILHHQEMLALVEEIRKSRPINDSIRKVDSVS